MGEVRFFRGVRRQGKSGGILLVRAIVGSNGVVVFAHDGSIGLDVCVLYFGSRRCLDVFILANGLVRRRG